MTQPLVNMTASTASQINFDSAAHPAIFSTTIYGALGYNCQAGDWPTFVLVGSSYDFSSINTSLHRWLVWIKGGIGF